MTQMTIDPIHVSFLSLFVSSLNITITLLRDFWYHRNIKATIYLNKEQPYMIVINRNDHAVHILNYVRDFQILDTKNDVDFIHEIDSRDSIKISSIEDSLKGHRKMYLFTGDYKKVKIKVVK